MRQEQLNDTGVDDITGQQAKDIGSEYGRLLMAQNPSEQQEARITEILELALTNQEIDRWVTHFTLEQGEKMGLLSEEAKKSYEDQKALLKEHLGNPSLSTTRDQAQKPAGERLNEQMRQHTIDTVFAAVQEAEQQDED